ncbi:glycosyltransferase [Herbaspirillum sp. CF444]|uniref:glycosyltransferase family 4 protein n=1 Tax=Herbaspirillum sp. CF444 TaxID=1144319 RepID=UPI000272344C|nr:glycosyltransferase family 4 protein [Herbaspirillum sp. CF444]EJL81446.1 glycosyltransferase [Herbaspirillum sp. CF444]
MKVLIVSQHFWPESFPINDMAKALVARGCEVDVLTGKPNYPDGKFFPGYKGSGCQREEWAGVGIYRVPLVARGSRSAIRLVLNYLSFIATGSVLGPWLLRGRRYDAIFVYATSPLLQALPALFLGFLKRTRVTVWVQDLWPESLAATGYVKNAFILKCVGKVVGFVYRHTDLLLVQSAAFKDSVERLAPGKTAVYYPNSVDAMFASDAVAESPRGDGALPTLPPHVFSVVFAGNVGAAQAVDVIADAAELLRHREDIAFFVFGKGSKWDWLAEAADKRGLSNLHLPGRFPVETMPGLMRQASVLLVTLADEPIFAATVPSKVQAYMAAGRPIIASLNGEGARLIAEAKAGLAVPAENAAALADAVLQLADMAPEEREQFGSNGRMFSRQYFDREKLIDQLVGYLSDAAGNAGEMQ